MAHQDRPYPEGSPTVDFVVLCGERSADCLRTVESCRGQRGVAATVHVVDRNSPIADLHRLRDALRDLPTVVYHTRGHDPGRSAGRNIGTRAGTAGVVIGLEAGAVFEDERCTAAAMRAFDDDPTLGALSFRVLEPGGDGFDPACWMSAHPRAEREDRAIPVIRFCGAAHAYRRAAFLQAGGFDPLLEEGWEELDLGLRMLDRGWWLRYEPGVTVRRTVRSVNRSSADHIARMMRDRVYLCRKYPGALGAPRAYALGYLLRGLGRGMFGASLAGTGEGLRMRVPTPVHLRPETLDYLDRHDGSLPGSLLGRLGPTAVTIERPARAVPGAIPLTGESATPK